MNIELFNAAMDKWVEAEAIAAEKARASGDERARSIALMKKSMFDTMLRTLGCKAPKAIEGCRKDLQARYEKQISLGDADAADRISIQLSCLDRVQRLIAELGDVV